MRNLSFLLFISYLLIISINLCSCEDLLELTCLQDSHCSQLKKYQPGIDVICVESYCQCIQIATGERIKCEPKDMKHSNVIGGACPCSQPNAECDDKQDICYCAENYVPSVDRRRCIKEAVELGAACEMDDQCTTPKVGNNLAICNMTHRRCQCSEGFAEHGSECLATVNGSSATCLNDSQCYEFDSVAVCRHTKINTNLCLCPPQFVSTANKTKCIKISDYGTKCNVHQQCQQKLGPGGICDNGVCICDEKYYDTRLNATDGSLLTVCKRKVVLGKYCRKDEECHQFHLQESDQSMTCCKGECNCKYGYNTVNNINCTLSSGVAALLPGVLSFGIFVSAYFFI